MLDNTFIWLICLICTNSLIFSYPAFLQVEAAYSLPDCRHVNTKGTQAPFVVALPLYYISTILRVFVAAVDFISLEKPLFFFTSIVILVYLYY